ncbi:MAG: sulfoxide reductase heme-binding subunit YedZ [Gammaproteobacteria bacterium]|jgi:sulfoxide reductase heme-binding subunit YedZ|nr:sulfoxide reductase heme-binding subunit YedZ [Gammaproteobacteria bacterium]
MWMKPVNTLLLRRRLIKPLVFALCCLPWLTLVLGGFGLAGFSLGANPVEMLLHTCGKWALNFLVITLCVTPLAHFSGWRALFAYRRMLGLFAFAYACAHLAVYLLLDQTLLWSAIAEDILKRPYITLGFSAWLLLLPLALTSTQGMMRRLGQRWSLLHRLIYPASILVAWHFYWQVKQDVREPLLYIAALTLLLGWRLAKRRSRRTAATKKAATPG